MHNYMCIEQNVNVVNGLFHGSELQQKFPEGCSPPAVLQACQIPVTVLWSFRKRGSEVHFFFVILMRTDFAAAVHPCMAFRFMPYLREHKPYILENIRITRYNWKFSLLR